MHVHVNRHTGKVITVESLHKHAITTYYYDVYTENNASRDSLIYYAYYMYYNTGLVQLTFEIRIRTVSTN